MSTGENRKASDLKALIRKYLRKGKPFTFQEVYGDESEPDDLPLYKAFSEMVKDGELTGPDPLSRSTRGNHSDWVYEKGSGSKQASLVKRVVSRFVG